MSPRGTDTPKSQGARALSLLGPIVAVSLAVLAWAAIRWVFELKDFVLPSPLGVANAFLDDPAPFLRGALQSAGSAMLGFAIAAIGGIVLGSLISLSRVVERSVYPLTLLFQMVPLVAIAPLLVLWFGYGRPAIVASAAIVSIFPVIASTVAGLGARDPNLDELFRVLGAGRLATWWKLALPSAVPSIMTGLKIAAGLATIGTVCGEFLAERMVVFSPRPARIVADIATPAGARDARFWTSDALGACVRTGSEAMLRAIEEARR